MIFVLDDATGCRLLVCLSPCWSQQTLWPPPPAAACCNHPDRKDGGHCRVCQCKGGLGHGASGPVRVQLPVRPYPRHRPQSLQDRSHEHHERIEDFCYCNRNISLLAAKTKSLLLTPCEEKTRELTIRSKPPPSTHHLPPPTTTSLTFASTPSSPPPPAHLGSIRIKQCPSLPSSRLHMLFLPLRLLLLLQRNQRVLLLRWTPACTSIPTLQRIHRHLPNRHMPCSHLRWTPAWTLQAYAVRPPSEPPTSP